MTASHAAILAFVRALGLLPRRLRWPALLHASALAAPVIRRAEAGAKPGVGVDGYREIALWRLLSAAAKAGLEYDPIVRHRHKEHVDAALATGRGVLVAGPHSLLVLLVPRYLHDLGRDPVAVRAGETVPLFGTKLTARSLLVSPAVLGETLRHLRSGDIVCSMIDRPGPEKGAVEVPTALGPIWIAEPPLRFARRDGAAIVFCTARIEEGAACITWGAPAGGEDLPRQFGDFVAARIEEGLGRGGPRSAHRDENVRPK